MIRIALAQINPVVGDLKGNSEKILQYVRKGKLSGADVVLFPELSVCGYPPQDLILKESFVIDCLNTLDYIASNIDDVLVIAGCITKNHKTGICNSAVIIKNKKILSVYNKIELPNYGVFDEKRYFCESRTIPVFKINGALFGLNICEDIWQNRVAEQQAKLGAKAIFNISASPYDIRKSDERVKVVTRKAKRLGTYIFYDNLVGGQDELVFDGNSFVAGPDGREKLRAKSFEEDIIFYDLKAPGSTAKAKGAAIIDLGKTNPGKKPLINKVQVRKVTSVEEIYRALVLATHDYVTKNGFKKVVIGISGGIDSALTAVIAAQALGRENVRGVTMPSVYSSKETLRDSFRLAESIGFKLIKIPITKIFDTYLGELKLAFTGVTPDTTEENLQARIRGNILMALSNKFGWMVLSTGNKSEVSCGYSTLYGDMVGGFNVLKDVYKTVVYELCEYINKKGEYIIPRSIIKRLPTAELRPNQKDTDSLPPYEILDEILKRYIELDMGCKEIIKEGRFDPQVVKRVIRLVDRNEYKRRQAPPGIKITQRAFDKDRRMPLTNKYEN